MSKGMIIYCRNEQCPNGRMWAIRSDRDSKIRLTIQGVANVIFLWGMNIGIYLRPQNLTNICIMNIFFINIWMFEYLHCENYKKSTNECTNIFIALKWIYSSKNIQIYLNIQIFTTHCNNHNLELSKLTIDQIYACKAYMCTSKSRNLNQGAFVIQSFNYNSGVLNVKNLQIFSRLPSFSLLPAWPDLS